MSELKCGARCLVVADPLTVKRAQSLDLNRVAEENFDRPADGTLQTRAALPWFKEVNLFHVL